MHLRLDVADIRRLGEAPPFAWSSYRYREQATACSSSRRRCGAAAGQDVGQRRLGRRRAGRRAAAPAEPGDVPQLAVAEIERGNIIVWEQPLAERQKGAPLESR